MTTDTQAAADSFFEDDDALDFTSFTAAFQGSVTAEREHWCMQALTELGEHIKAKTGRDLPAMIKVSCGFTRERKHDAKGETWLPSTTSNGWSNVFISPYIDDGHEVLSILLHEVLHVVAGSNDHRVRSGFPYLARRVGMTGKPTGYQFGAATQLDVFCAVVKRLGPYPHQKLNPEDRPRKKDGTRQRKLGCPDCGIVFRGARATIRKGLPLCGTTKPERCTRYGVAFELWCDDCEGYGDHFTEDCPGVEGATQPAP